MTKPRILTVILNYRTPELTLRATEAAIREMRSLGGEVVIVDNASQDGSAVVLQSSIIKNHWDDICRFVESPVNGGFGAGCNLGMRQGMSDGCDPDFYYLLNSDAWPDLHAVAPLVRLMQREPRAGMAGSHIRGEDGAEHCTVFRFPSIAGEFEGSIRLGLVTRMLRDAVVPMDIPRQTTEVDWTAGASLLIRREMLDEIGLFDETFFLYYEETELCRRANRAGWGTYYVPESRVVHVGSVSTGRKGWKRTPSYWFDSRWHYFTKVDGRTYASVATFARILGGILWRLRRFVSHRPMEDPPHFLRDLLAHSFGVLGQPTSSTSPLISQHLITEDHK